MTPQWRRGPTDRDIDRELRGFLTALTEEKIRAGLDPETARREALIEMGGMAQVKEQVRNERPGAGLDVIMQDIRYALRALRHQPAFTVTVIAVLALGIGANATMFGVIDKLLLQPPAKVADPEGVVSITYDRTSRGERSSQEYLSYPVYLDAVAATDAFAQVAAYAPTSISAGTGPDAHLLRGMRVTSNYFTVLGVQPVRGRFLTPAEDGPSPPAVAVISEAAWQRDHGGAEVIGTSIRLGGTSYRIIGIAPRDFTGIARTPVDVWIPFTSGANAKDIEGWKNSRNAFWFLAVARLKPGISADRAAILATPTLLAGERRDGTTEAQIADRQPAIGTVSILPREGIGNNPDAKVALLIGFVSFLVFVIACANVAGLQVARALQRKREIALRVTLGATGRRLIGQLLVESLMLSVAGGIAALAVAVAAGGFVRSVLFSSMDWTLSVADGRMIAFTLVASIIAGGAIGILPVVHARRVELSAAMKGGVREGRGSRSNARRTLLIVQTALTVVLLVGTGLFVRSLERVRDLPLGMHPEHVLMADLRTTGMRYTDEQIEALYQRLQQAASQMPDIANAAMASSLPFHSTYAMRVRVPGRDSLPRVADGGPYYTAVTSGYFDVMGMRVLRGRGLEPADDQGARVVVINESMAKLWWPGRNALGQCMKIGGDSVPCSQVVGIVENPRRQSVLEETSLQYFIPLPHAETTSRLLVMRSRIDPQQAAERIRAGLQRADPSLPYVRVRPLEQLIAPQTQSWRLGARMFSAFGVLSLLLAAVGLYGMLAYDVSQRGHELGVRVALGANVKQIATSVIGQGMQLLLAGVALGLVLALASGRFIQHLLFETSANDPAVLTGVVVVLAVVGLGAMLVPTVRATRADPLSALRSE